MNGEEAHRQDFHTADNEQQHPAVGCGLFRGSVWRQSACASGCRSCGRRRGSGSVCGRFPRPRSQVRGMPPRLRLWAEDRSTISARFRFAAFPTLERRRLRLACRRRSALRYRRAKAADAVVQRSGDTHHRGWRLCRGIVSTSICNVISRQ